MSSPSIKLSFYVVGQQFVFNIFCITQYVYNNGLVELYDRETEKYLGVIVERIESVPNYASCNNKSTRIEYVLIATPSKIV